MSNHPKQTRDIPDHVKTNLKRFVELQFWKSHINKSSGRPDNAHFRHCFTSLFNIPEDFYNGLSVLDVGCGPLGSLEWATQCKSRVGVDPLAGKYREIVAADHDMVYVTASAEQLPFEDCSFDVVSCFNALDHVENPDNVLSEILRVCRPNGTILIMVEVNHPPTTTEPHSLSPAFTGSIQGAQLVQQSMYSLRADQDIYASIMEAEKVEDMHAKGVLCARLMRC